MRQRFNDLYSPGFTAYNFEADPLEELLTRHGIAFQRHPPQHPRTDDGGWGPAPLHGFFLPQHVFLVPQWLADVETWLHIYANEPEPNNKRQSDLVLHAAFEVLFHMHTPAALETIFLIDRRDARVAHVTYNDGSKGAIPLQPRASQRLAPIARELIANSRHLPVVNTVEGSSP